MRSEAQMAVRLMVKTRADFQAIRKAMDNRLGRKADGTEQAVERPVPAEMLRDIVARADACRKEEGECEKALRRALKQFPVYAWLQGVKGVGEIAAGWIIGEIDIEEASTVSKIWQYCGTNPGMVRGKKAMKRSEYKPSMGEIVGTLPDAADGGERVKVLTDTMIRGDKATEGFLLPYNKPLRTALVGVLADGFIKAKSSYALEYYYPYKHRLEQSDNAVGGKPWKDVSKGHRDRAAKRYMVKMFLRDLYVAWREAEGLPVREPYAEEYLGKRHRSKEAHELQADHHPKETHSSQASRMDQEPQNSKASHVKQEARNLQASHARREAHALKASQP